MGDEGKHRELGRGCSRRGRVEPQRAKHARARLQQSSHFGSRASGDGEGATAAMLKLDLFVLWLPFRPAESHLLGTLGCVSLCPLPTSPRS
jgi:hypothetical protein